MSSQAIGLKSTILRITEALPFALACMLAIFGIVKFQGFGSSNNWMNILEVYSPLLIVCIGQMLVMLTGGIDLSATSTMALCSVVGAKLMSTEVGWIENSSVAVPMAIAAMLGVSICVGLANGIAVAYLRMPAFMVTLTSMFFLSGLATYVTASEQIGGLPDSFVDIAMNPMVAATTAAILAVAVYFVMSKHVYGKWLFAVGQNVHTADLSGVPTQVVTASTYVASSITASIAAMIYTAQLATGSPSLGNNLLLDIIGAVVIGGTSLFGGRGDVRLLCGGVLFFVLLEKILNFWGWSQFGVMLAKGVMILMAATIDSLRSRWICS